LMALQTLLGWFGELHVILNNPRKSDLILLLYCLFL
jgi:hypothetical protein